MVFVDDFDVVDDDVDVVVVVGVVVVVLAVDDDVVALVVVGVVLIAATCIPVGVVVAQSENAVERADDAETGGLIGGDIVVAVESAGPAVVLVLDIAALVTAATVNFEVE